MLHDAMRTQHSGIKGLRTLSAALLAASVLFVGAATLPASQAVADTLIINEVSEAAGTADSRPRRGMSMDQVREGWGEPVTAGAAVGEPPITRWEYDGFAVFFENQTVLHTVKTTR